MKRNNLTTSLVAGLAAVAGMAAVGAQTNICKLYEHDGRSDSRRSPKPRKATGAAKIQRDAKKKRNKKR